MGSSDLDNGPPDLENNIIRGLNIFWRPIPSSKIIGPYFVCSNEMGQQQTRIEGAKSRVGNDLLNSCS